MLVVGKHPQKLTLLAGAGHRHGAALDRRSTSVQRHRRRLHGLGDRAADGTEAGSPARDDRAEDDRRRQQTLAWAPFVIDEVTLVGSRCGPFDRALEALERGEVSVQPLISERYDLTKGLEALDRAQAKSVLKVLLNVSQG